MAPSSDHDVLLGRVLPHVQPGIINQVQRSIIEVDWDDHDSSESLDYDLDPRLRSMSTPSRQSRTNSTSDISYAGRSGGLSPPRRVAFFADFDGVNDSFSMADKAITGENRQTSAPANKHVTSTFAHVLMPADLEPSATDGTSATATALQKSDSRASYSGARSSASSLGHQRRLSGVYSPIEPPPRSSSSRLEKTSEPQGLAAIASAQHAQNLDKPLPPLNSGPPRERSVVNNLVLRDDNDEEAEDNLELTSKDLAGQERLQQRNGFGTTHIQQHQGHRPSTSNGRSSTPPPISNVRRMVVYDDFEEEDPLRGFEDHAAPQITDLAATGGPLFEHSTSVGSQKPPVAMRNATRERRLDSMSSEGSRGVHMQHNGVGAMHSRMVPLAANYRDLRTPVLDHVQLYHDAESKKPLFDPASDGRVLHTAHQKPRRILDDSSAMLYNGHGHSKNVPGTSSSAAGNSIMYSGGNDHLQVRNLPLRRAFSDDEVSVRHSISGKTTASLGSQSMPDFFSASIFQVVLHNPTTAHRLLKFSESRLCAENVEFLSKVDAYRTTLNGLAEQMSTIHKTFISPGSPSQINVNGALLKRAHRDMRSLVTTALPSLENLFTDLQEQIETLVFQDVYPRFVRHQMALSASRALGSDRFKYQGLGDCFCLTNPNVADNPIVFASDGFVKVTGYTRPEIVPRNCRFLQGAHTDRQAVTRLRNAIYEQKESVELLLNYKKNGDPFWNLLYVVPLFNSRGKCEFFLGGQVNCSTTIHSNVDVMKVLSMSDTADTDEIESQRHATTPSQKSATRPSARRTFLKALGVRHEDHPPLPTGDAGMENGVLGRMEGLDLSSQMKEFYTAYSKFLIIRANTWTIEFYSDGVVEAFNPANMASSMVAGSDVFRFFGLHMLSKQSDYKTRVRNAIRAGVPISTALRLQTRRSAVFRGDEAFLAHWTPLKDEKALVHWIAVTLAPMNF